MLRDWHYAYSACEAVWRKMGQSCSAFLLAQSIISATHIAWGKAFTYTNSAFDGITDAHAFQPILTGYLLLHVLQPWRKVLQLAQLLGLSSHGFSVLLHLGICIGCSFLQDLLLSF